MNEKITLFWFRRDLRLHDNAGLYTALKDNQNVQCLFIFDENILKNLDTDDARVTFIFETVEALKAQLLSKKSDLWVFFGQPENIFKKLVKEHSISGIYCNHDYEPKAIARDKNIEKIVTAAGGVFKTFKDQVIFEKDEVLTDARKPYTVFTPYKNKWLKSLSPFYLKSYPVESYFPSLLKKAKSYPRPSLKDMGFEKSAVKFPSTKYDKLELKNYAKLRDFPALDATSRLGLHLRFGTLSIRELVSEAKKISDVWLSELIWREFFMQILFHFPYVESRSFREDYEKINWRDDKKDFKIWCDGKTGYPLVDAGMRELNETGYMHNRVRMVVASFLTKHLLIHWSWGEKYFAKKLLDYEMSANNGNWQWAAGTGCDAAPYFRVFNPESQMEKFDPDLEYVKKWVPEYGSDKYPEPMIDHKEGRERALREFSKALKK